MAAHRTICRACHNGCALDVEIEDNQVKRLRGVPEDPLYRGYSCIKGRAQGAMLTRPDRLLHSMAMAPDGRHRPIDSTRAMDEIAARLADIVARHGPRAVAGYRGTQSYVPGFTGLPFFDALFARIGSSMIFTPNTIDKGGKDTALSLHGRWMAPTQGYDDPDAVMLFGINPVLTYTGLPLGTPRWYSDGRRAGVKTIVIDPRRSDTARLAFLHLQPRPGCDVQILAAILRTIIDEGLYDRAFVAAEVDGLAALRAHLEPFSPDQVARVADVPAGDILLAARTYAGARRGYAMAGTGPNMSGPSTLIEYLMLAMETLCGRWLRAGDVARAVPSLLPAPAWRAQVRPPRAHWAIGEAMRIRGLSLTEAGMPTGALPDEILEPGEGQVRALICFGGNPAVAFPDQIKTIEALRSLELLVQIDPWMSATSTLAHYVIAPPLPLEEPASTAMADMVVGMGKSGYGVGEPYASYAPRLLDRPAGSDLIEEWRFFHGLIARMGHDTVIANPFNPAGSPIEPDAATTTDDILAWVSEGSRIPLDAVKAEPGRMWRTPSVVIQPKEPGWTARFDIAAAPMMDDLGRFATTVADAGDGDDAAYPLRMICRREGYVFNSSWNVPETNGGRGYSPAYIHPSDLAALDLVDGDAVEVASAHGAIPAIVQGDANLRRGLVSMMFGFGGGPERDAEFREIGSSTNRLTCNDRGYDRYTGQPQMSNIPVAVRRLAEA